MRCLAFAIATMGLVAGCHGRSDPPPTPTEAPAASGEHAPDEHAELPRHVTLSADVVTQAGIRSTPAKKATLFAALDLPGEVVADPDRLARISSPVAGRIERVSLHEGDVVKRGDVLITLRVPEVGRVRAVFRATAARAKAARSNAKRLRALYQQRLSAEQAALSAEADADALAIEARSLGEQLGALGAGGGALSITLRAPIAGTIVARDAVVGQPVSADQVVGTVADLSEAWFLGRVFEKDMGQVRTGAAAEVSLNAFPSDRFGGSVEYLGQQVDPIARTVTARVRLKNRDGLLRLGLFGTARVATSSQLVGEARLVVPRSALTDVAGKTVVFVERAPGDFDLHEVTPGRAAVGEIEILAGLREGERVVDQGVFTLKSVVLKAQFGGED